MLEHDDQAQDVDMIKSVLQRIIDEMNSFEADRIMPEDRKKKEIITEIQTEGSPDEESMELESAEGGLSSDVLTELMSKAESADETGSLPEDRESELPLELEKLVREKKSKK